MRVAIIGAGIAGLAAARTLTKAQHQVVLYEALSRTGGRVATRVLDSYVFDTGATSIAPRGRSLEPVMLGELDQSKLVKVELPIYIHSSLRVSMGDISRTTIERYTYRNGNEELPRMLSQGLEIRLETPVERFQKLTATSYKVGDEEYEAIIVAMPGPEANIVLEESDESRPMGFVKYRECISVQLGYALPLEGIHYHAIIDPEQRHPLTWLSVESAKSPDRAKPGHTALVAQLSPQFSAMYFDADEGAIVGATVEYIERLYGKGWDAPEAIDIKRWKHSQPESLALFDSVNAIPGRVVVAGDCLIGGRVEYAFESGVRAANRLLQMT